MKKVITLVLVSSFLIPMLGCAYEATPVSECDVIFEEFGAYELYESEDLTLEILENREGTVVVERCEGVVLDAETGDGKLLGDYDGFDYISYEGVDGIYDGAYVVTYLVYNSENNICDDVVERFDFVEWRNVVSR